MIYALLEEKEFRVADARRKVAWLEEEYRELQLSPVVRAYIHIRSKFREGLSPEEESRFQKFRESEEWHYLNCNELNLLQAYDEINAALDDIIAYRKNNNIVPVLMNTSPKSAATGDNDPPDDSPDSSPDGSPDGSPTSVVSSTAGSNAFNKQLKSEKVIVVHQHLLDEDDIVALAVAEKQRELQLHAASKAEASLGRKSTTAAAVAAAHAAMSNGNGVSHHHNHQQHQQQQQHTMSFAEAQLRAKPSSSVRNGGMSASAAVASKPAMPIRSASEGLASAPAMPVVRAASSASSNTIGSQSGTLIQPPPPPPPPPGPPPVVNTTPAGPYAAALAGKQPPPPPSHISAPVAPPPAAAAMSVPVSSAPVASAPRQIPWGDANASAPIPQQQQAQQPQPQQQQQQHMRPRVAPPGFQQETGAPAPIYQQPGMIHSSQSGLLGPPSLQLPPHHQMNMAAPRIVVDGSSGGFVPLFGSLDLSQQQQQQHMQMQEQQHHQMAVPMPTHQSSLGLDWGLGGAHSDANGGGGGGQYALSSSMVDHHHGPSLFVTHHQQSLQAGYIHHSVVGVDPYPHALPGSYGAAGSTGMIIGSNGEGPLPGSTTEADGIDDVLRMQPWLLE